jgi:hypothetical protein
VNSISLFFAKRSSEERPGPLLVRAAPDTSYHPSRCFPWPLEQPANDFPFDSAHVRSTLLLLPILEVRTMLLRQLSRPGSPPWCSSRLCGSTQISLAAELMRSSSIFRWWGHTHKSIAVQLEEEEKCCAESSLLLLLSFFPTKIGDVGCMTRRPGPPSSSQAGRPTLTVVDLMLVEY